MDALVFVALLFQRSTLTITESSPCQYSAYICGRGGWGTGCQGITGVNLGGVTMMMADDELMGYLSVNTESLSSRIVRKRD